MKQGAIITDLERVTCDLNRLGVDFKIRLDGTLTGIEYDDIELWFDVNGKEFNKEMK